MIHPMSIGGRCQGFPRQNKPIEPTSGPTPLGEIGRAAGGPTGQSETMPRLFGRVMRVLRQPPGSSSRSDSQELVKLHRAAETRTAQDATVCGILRRAIRRRRLPAAINRHNRPAAGGLPRTTGCRRERRPGTAANVLGLRRVCPGLPGFGPDGNAHRRNRDDISKPPGRRR